MQNEHRCLFLWAENANIKCIVEHKTVCQSTFAPQNVLEENVFVLLDTDLVA